MKAGRWALAAVLLPVTVAGGSAATATAPTSVFAPTSSSASAVASTQEVFSRLPPGARWDVGAPSLGVASRRNDPFRKQCAPSQIHAIAKTRRTAGGVVGVVTLTGRRCAPIVTHAPHALLAANGARLAVPTVPQPNRVSPPANYRSPLGYSPLLWSFAWQGSWCGARATSVVLPASDPPFGLRVVKGVRLHSTPRLVVPLTGPSPRCDGSLGSSLVPGLAGYRGGPVQTAPADWSKLAATLVVPAVAPYSPIAGLSVTLHNHGGQPVALSPCPTYRLLVTVRSHRTLYEPRQLVCTPQPTTVPAHASVAIPLHGAAGGFAHPGEVVRFRFGMAGVPTAAAVLQVSTLTPPTLDPSHGGVDTDWQVLDPVLDTPIGGIPFLQPRCPPGAITATARTRRIPGGVAGLVTLTGNHCSIPIEKGPDELLAADGLDLGVTTIPIGDQTPSEPLSEYALDRGLAIWSFAWTDSWCGARAASIALPLTATKADLDPGQVVAPITGPQPRCHSSAPTRSTLTVGAVGWPGRPDLLPLPSWSGLQATIAVAKVIRDGLMTDIRATFTNPTSQAIPLAPCPTYEMTVFDRYGDGGGTVKGGPLRCPLQPRVVPANGSVTIALPDTRFYRRDLRPDARPVTVTFAITGVPPATTPAKVGPVPIRDPSHGGKRVRWRVAPPLIEFVSGPAPPAHPTCKASQIHVSARTRRGPGGVVGVIHVYGHDCRLRIRRSPSALLDGAGKPLNVKIRNAPAADRGATIRPDLDLAAGNAYWGFAWRGSWCGPFATSVQVELADGSTVDGRVHGHSPPCDVKSDAVVYRGLVGGADEPLQTAPPSWARLRATLSVPDVGHGSRLIHPSVVLTNRTSKPITLAPCPSYALTVTSRSPGAVSLDGYEPAFPCSLTPRIIPADGHATVALRAEKIDRSELPPHGGRVTVRFAIAGVATATAHARVAP